jgi:very-short-patch-repair endonuclease
VFKRKTDEQFKKEVFDLVGEEYTILEEYKGSQTKIKIRHNKCDNIYEVRPNDFLNGSRCPYCAGLKKKTTEEFKKEVFNVVGDEYEVLGEYVNSRTKIKIRHNICGHEWKVIPNSFLQGSRCPNCSKKKPNEQFVREVFELVEDEYTVLGEYINAQTKIKLKHNICGNIYEVQPATFLFGNRCPVCSMKIAGIKKTKTTEEFKQEVFDLVGNEYSVLEPYIKGNIKIKMKHNKCGNEYYVRPNSFLGGNRCPKCKDLNRTKTDEQFKKEVFDLVGEEYSVLGEYEGANKKIKMRHNKCGYEWEVKPANFLQGSRCPYCKASKGEEKIAKYLTKFGIKFETQKTFKDLKDKILLRFDFYIPNKNLLIEYDGIQHFEPVDFGGINNEEIVKENFKNQQIRDKMKNEYCKENGIKLLRIKYTDFKNIKKILKNNV